MNRRSVLGALGAAGAVSAAGCASSYLGDARSYAPPLVEDRPNAVYVPSHVEGAKTVGTARAGRCRCAVTYTYPHRFWLVTGEERETVGIRRDDSLHLMATLWDAETGVSLPTAGVTVEVSRAESGETVARKSLWPMLSQPMGFHFGDNVALPGEGRYEVSLRIAASDARTGGALDGAFAEGRQVSVGLDYDRRALNRIRVDDLDERQGERGAVDPAAPSNAPTGRLPAVEALPGRALGRARRGGATVALRATARPPTGIGTDGGDTDTDPDAEEAYLAASPRTPYNRYPLPFVSVSATVRRDGETVFDRPLPAAVDPAFGYHYGSPVDDVRPGDGVTLSVDTPPQAARHEGYETAFLDFDPLRTTVHRAPSNP